jgi:hypothetical protein
MKYDLCLLQMVLWQKVLVIRVIRGHARNFIITLFHCLTDGSSGTPGNAGFGHIRRMWPGTPYPER